MIHLPFTLYLPGYVLCLNDNLRLYHCSISLKHNQKKSQGHLLLRKETTVGHNRNTNIQNPRRLQRTLKFEIILVASKYFQGLSVIQYYRTHFFPQFLIHFQIASVHLLLLALIG